jgi:hypothetical protein
MNSATRTPEQTHIALFWQSPAGGAVAQWNAVARNLVDQYAIDFGDSALLFAMVNLSAADALINCWNDKYYWDFWRPWTAIQRADEDGNPATEPDPSWTALLTAPYPEHPSGHLATDGAYLRVLLMFFGTDEIGFDVTSSRFPGELRHFDRFSDALEEIIEARIWAGLHFRTADVQAEISAGQSPTTWRRTTFSRSTDAGRHGAATRRPSPRRLGNNPRARQPSARVSSQENKGVRRLACSCLDFEPLLAGTAFQESISCNPRSRPGCNHSLLPLVSVVSAGAFGAFISLIFR